MQLRNRLASLATAVSALSSSTLPLVAAASAASVSVNETTPRPDKDGKFWISSDVLKLGFVEYGASISDLQIEDKNGIRRDVVAGWDNATYYTLDSVHPTFGAVPGRYANRIKNSTFEIDGRRYNVSANENDGRDTLHGGADGWSWRNFTAVAHTPSSVTFSIVDPDGKEGFPGQVISYVTYAVDGPDWYISIVAVSTTEKTPIMLTSHTYWNLDGFANTGTNTALNHTLHMPYGRRRVAVDGILIPTGDIVDNPEGSVNDFWSRPKQLGASFGDPDIQGNCGTGCAGYDNCWTVDRDDDDDDDDDDTLGHADWLAEEPPVVSVHSDFSGIGIDVYTDQAALQMYACNGMDGTVALKRDQGFHGDDAEFPRTIPQYGCLVLEVQDYIDGINNPQWGRLDKQIWGPDDGPYTVRAKYHFTVDK
ncbi:aldose 1-epimerase [Geosmithia morbida]|uniref:Aldose 1-epimerase n=1 Tax=Geosmithia morbida TaxID=1094350 RepID=A0A9P5D5C1_9HYPO|nr:aldose 1-epimerase [Geosmithia morbida]KAF4123635.1 aldose 1-epimerase [Geosmithia morbida]